ncbi:hypothetical protein JMUB7531_29110 [Staphylococcus aureus]
MSRGLGDVYKRQITLSFITASGLSSVSYTHLTLPTTERV